MIPEKSIPPGSIQAPAFPFCTQIPDCAVPHTFVQPIDFRMPNPRPGDTNRESGTSGWRESVTAPSLTPLVPVPGCLLGSEPATCPNTLPAGRKFTPVSTSATGSNSSAGPVTPPFTLLLSLGPCELTVSELELIHAHVPSTTEQQQKKVQSKNRECKQQEHKQKQKAKQGPCNQHAMTHEMNSTDSPAIQILPSHLPSRNAKTRTP